MKRLRLISTILTIPTLIMSGQTIRERLTLAVTTPVEKKTDGIPLWDLTQTLTTPESGARYLIYGDTLLSETIDGWRRWFAINGDTLTLCREESLRRAVEYRDTVVIDGERRSTPFSADVIDTEENRFLRRGAHTSEALERCLIVPVPGDTLKVVMRRETTEYSELPDPMLADPDYTASEERRCRREVISWLSGGLIPEAVMVTEWSLDGGKETELGRTCYLKERGTSPEDSPLRDDEKDPEQETLGILDNMEILWRDGSVVLMLSSPMPCPFSVDVLTDQGLSLSHREFSGKGELLPEIPVSGPLTGRLMTVVTTPWRQIVRLITIE